ncbi:unnamed protein product, partial [Porites evermanni]
LFRGSILSRGGNHLLALSINSYFKRYPANFFILNLAVCDLLIGFPGELLFGLRHWFPDNPTLIQAGSESTKSSCILLDLEPLKHSISERTMAKDTLALL